MKIYKRNIAWATMTRDDNGQVTYCTDDCEGIVVYVYRFRGKLRYGLIYDIAGTSFNSVSTRLTPQAWAAIKADVEKFI